MVYVNRMLSVGQKEKKMNEKKSLKGLMMGLRGVVLIHERE